MKRQGHLAALRYLARRHRSEQKRTFSQSFDHFFRQAKGLSQAAQIFEAKSPFFTIFGISKLHFPVRGQAP